LTVLEFGTERVVMAEQATPVLAQHPKTLLNIDRRAWLRFPCELDIICLPVSNRCQDETEGAWLGNIRDVSFCGIGLRMKRRFEPGTAMSVELSESKTLRRRLLVHVIHASPEADGRWIIGCTFDCPLSQQELQAFLE
jgi:hypothetical protein